MRKLHAMSALVGLTLAVLAVVLAYDPAPPSRYPELLSVSRSTRERIRKALPPPSGPGYREDFENYSAEESLAGFSAREVLAVLQEDAGAASCVTMTGATIADDRRVPVGAWLARHVDASLDDVLLRLLHDRELVFALRDAAAIALCREGNVAVLPALVAFVTDDSRSELLRKRILYRLPRIGARLGPDIEALVGFRFHGLDEIAAAALAVTGDPIAPGLIRDGLTEMYGFGSDREHLLVRGVLAIAGEDPEIAARARMILGQIESLWTDGELIVAKKSVTDLGSHFARWLEAHPRARASAFERARAEYPASDRYRRERATLAAEEPWTLPDEDFDMAAALFGVHPNRSERRIRWLEALDRMAAFLRREISGETDPQKVLGVLHRRVLSPRRRSLGGVAPDIPGPPSYLERVLLYRSGNCLGWTSLYLALADRLDLPLVPVSTPGHVFVRWDDGEKVIDVELTAMGMWRPGGGTGRKAPRVISRQEVVASLYINRSHTWRVSGQVQDKDRYEKALLYADRAVAWAPTCLDGHVARVQALTALGDPATAARAAEQAIAAFDADPASVVGLTRAGDVLLNAGDPTRALAWYDRAWKLDPEDGEILRRRLGCLQLLERNEDLIREATAFLAERDHHGVRLFRLGAMARTADERWRTELRAVEGEGAQRQLIRMNVAEELLGRGAWEEAGEVLDGLDGLDEDAAEAKRRPALLTVEALTNDAVQQSHDDTLLLDRWRRSIRLRARVLETAGKTREAEALRETIHR